MNVGAVITTDGFSFGESVMTIAPNATVAPSTAQSFTLGTYTMPFTGNLVADLLLKFSMAAYQNLRVYMTASTPAPTYAPDLPWANGLPGGYVYAHDLPCIGKWDNLTKGTVVTLIITASIGGNGASVTIANIGGLIRAYQT